MTTLRPCQRIETLAAHCHEQWSGWMKYLFSKMDGRTIPEWAWNRWQKQAFSPYSELSEDEKESDRKEARRILEVLRTSPESSWRTRAEEALREARAALEKICNQDQFDDLSTNCPQTYVGHLHLIRERVLETAKAALAKIEALRVGAE